MKYLMSEKTAGFVRGLMRGGGYDGATGATRPVQSRSATGDDFAAPYAVGYAASANEGAGSWIIWLPGYELLYVDGDAVDVTSGLSAAGGEYPEGWYALPAATMPTDVGGTLYLVVERGSIGAVSARFAAQPGSGSVAAVAAVAVCTATVEDGGARHVEQFVTSAVTISTGAEVDVDNVSIEDQHDEPKAGSTGDAKTVRELAVKGWHTSPSDPNYTMVQDVGLPQDADAAGSEEAVQRTNGAKSALRYRKVGRVDKAKILSTIEKTGGGTDEDTTVTVTDLAGNETEFTIPNMGNFDAEADATTLGPTAQATADVTLANKKFSFEFGIPKGDKGVDGVSVTGVTASAGTASEDNGYTITPITFTFTFSDGTTKAATANIRAKNGAAASGTAHYVHDVRYSASSPGDGVQKKMATLDLATGAETVDVNWTTFAETSPHSGEHPSSE